MGRFLHLGLPLRKAVDHSLYIDDASLESEGLLSEVQDASHGPHSPQTGVLSRRELDRTKDEDVMRIGLLGPMM